MQANRYAQLCAELKINANELLSGEKLTMDNYTQHAEENLLALKEETERQTKQLLMLEDVLAIVCIIAYLALTFSALFIPMTLPARITLIAVAIVLLLICTAFGLLIEQTAGYYECQKCRHRYVPSYKQVLFAAHCGRTRYMKCPVCAQRSWQKKVLTKDE